MSEAQNASIGTPQVQNIYPATNITDIIERASDSEKFIAAQLENLTRGRENVDYIWHEDPSLEHEKDPLKLFEIQKILDPSGNFRYFKRVYRNPNWKPAIEDPKLAAWLEEHLRDILNAHTLIRNTKNVEKELRNIIVAMDGELFLLMTNPKNKIRLDGPTYVRITDLLANTISSVFYGTTTSQGHLSNKEVSVSMKSVNVQQTVGGEPGQPQGKPGGIGGFITGLLPKMPGQQG